MVLAKETRKYKFIGKEQRGRKIRRLEEEEISLLMSEGKSSIASSNSCQQFQQNLLRAFLLQGVYIDFP